MTDYDWLQGVYAGTAAAVKVFNLKIHGAAAACKHEKFVYAMLKRLQGKVLPTVLCTGVLDYTSCPVIITTLHGTALLEDGLPVRSSLHEPLGMVLQALHDEGAAHGSVRRPNFLVKGEADVRLCDLTEVVLDATDEQKARDMQQLEAMLKGN